MKMNREVAGLITFILETVPSSQLIQKWGSTLFYSTVLSLQRNYPAVRSFKSLEKDFRDYFQKQTTLLTTNQVAANNWFSDLRDRIHLDSTRAYLSGSLYEDRKVTFNTSMQDEIERRVGEQTSYLASFRDEFNAGKYKGTPSKALWRAGLYASFLAVMFRAGWIAKQAEDTVIFWRVTPGKEHCGECLELEMGGPYTRKTLPKLPGEATCRGNCGCYLETKQGKKV